MKLSMVVSLVVNVVLTVFLGIEARNANKRVTETADADLFACNDTAKTVAKISYLTCCMTASVETRQLEQGDPLIPVFMDYCTQGAEKMADKIDLKR